MGAEDRQVQAVDLARFEMHVRDTLEAGAGLCKETVVRTIVEEGPDCIAELIDLGMKFSERDAPGAGEREAA